MERTLYQMVYKLYIDISLAIAYLSNILRIFKEHILIWLLVILPEVIWKWLWAFHSNLLKVNIKPHTNLETQLIYRLKWAFYFGLHHDKENEVYLLNINYMYNLIKRAYKKESTISLTYVSDNIINELDIDLINRKYKPTADMFWKPILFNRLKL